MLFAECCINSLIDGIKGKVSKDESVVSYIFFINNYNFIKKTLTAGPVRDLLGPETEGIEKRLADNMAIARLNIKKVWEDFAKEVTIEDPTEKSVTKSSYAKNIFTVFNKRFSEMYTEQRKMTLVDLDIRGEIQVSIESIVLPAYQALVQFYERIPFSRNKSKYISYTFETLRQMMKELFKGSSKK